MDIKHARMLLKNYRIRPNRAELRLQGLLSDYLPGEFRFNDGSFTIEGKIPDFVCINYHKAVIELIGNRKLPGHSKEALEAREALFARWGFRTLYIYQEDLKLSNEEELVNDIIFFLTKNIK